MSKSTLRGEIVGKLKEYSPVSIVGRRETADAILQAVLEALPEKRMTQADRLRAQGHRIVGSSPFVDAENDAYNQAIDDIKAILEADTNPELENLIGEILQHFGNYAYETGKRIALNYGYPYEPDENHIEQSTAKDEILKLFSQHEQEAISKALDSLWKNEELQKSIELYGEWNSTKLDEAYETAKANVLFHIQEKRQGNE